MTTTYFSSHKAIYRYDKELEEEENNQIFSEQIDEYFTESNNLPKLYLVLYFFPHKPGILHFRMKIYLNDINNARPDFPFRHRQTRVGQGDVNHTTIELHKPPQDTPFAYIYLGYFTTRKNAKKFLLDVVVEDVARLDPRNKKEKDLILVPSQSYIWNTMELLRNNYQAHGSFISPTKYSRFNPFRTTMADIDVRQITRKNIGTGITLGAWLFHFGIPIAWAVSAGITSSIISSYINPRSLYKSFRRGSIGESIGEYKLTNSNEPEPELELEPEPELELEPEPEPELEPEPEPVSETEYNPLITRARLKSYKRKSLKKSKRRKSKRRKSKRRKSKRKKRRKSKSKRR